MKIGAVGLGNRIAHVFHELSQINKNAELISYVDPLPIGKEYAEKHNFFPSKNYSNLKAVSYTHLRAHETPEHLVCRLLLEKKNKIEFQDMWKPISYLHKI